MSGPARAIFRAGSRTYYGASRFFPRDFRAKVATLYAFVRGADDFVDATPQDAPGFRAFRGRWNAAAGGALSGDPVVDSFVGLCGQEGLPREWTEAFLDAMESDLTVRVYDSLEALLSYVYGSAEVIGLFMARLMGLPDAAREAARALGRAMQYVNFIRDFTEDRDLGRRYLPLEGADPRVADPTWARGHAEQFSAFLRGHIARYRQWAGEGRAGFRLIPRAYRIAIATAQDMYDWTAARIEREPLVALDRKVKPSAARIGSRALLNALSPGGGA